MSRNYTAEDGSRPVDFIDCVAYRNVAENIAKYCRKGSQVLVDGSLQTRYYEHPNKVNIKIYEVIVNNILFLESKKECRQARTSSRRERRLLLPKVTYRFKGGDV